MYVGKKLRWKEDNKKCWNCISHKDKVRGGYKIFVRNKKRILIHRYIYEINFGKIPKGKIIRHKCDNPNCINPKHLILGTQKENMQDMKDRERSLYGIKNHKAKLTEKQAKEIYLLNFPYKEIAKKYKISKEAITSIKNDKNWIKTTKNLIKNSINTWEIEK